MTIAVEMMMSMILLTLCALAINTPNARPAAEEAKPLKGTYSTTHADEKWTLTFDGKEKFTLKKKDDVLVEGTYKSTKDEVELTDKEGPIASPDAKPGKYKWTLKDKVLRFTKVEDELEGRAAAITTGSWKSEE